MVRCRGDGRRREKWCRDVTHLYPISQSLTNNNSALRVDANPSGALELATPFTLSSELEQEAAVGVEYLDAVVVAVCDDDTPIVINSDAEDAVELADFGSFPAEFQQGLA